MKKYARKCKECDNVFNEGFCIFGGEEYYCCEACLSEHWTVDEFNEMYNGEATYTILVTTEAKSLKEAERYFRDYECEGDIEIWKLQVYDEVTDIEDLWEWL